MAPKAKKEAPAPVPPTAEAKAKALKAKKAVLKGVHSHKKKRRSTCHPLPVAQDTGTPEAAQISLEERPQESELDHYAISKFLLTPESAMRKTEGNNTPNKLQIKQAVKRLCDMDVAEANT
ncbi:hypothetical protein P7K49_027705 [Saguinus oedipus]|uniref:Large ribosomal subunit protein uL23 N-terminal domain-containing protein n=1 Tax=Saguinus oedipus TaxID=9490 RepID=A0ABQ9UCG6_SAGOE|nr:hypothetical protein P7K49_027705 [Saguinus oedipus]